MAWLTTLLIVLAALVAAWVVFIAFVAIAKPDSVSISTATRLLPDLLRLVRRLAADRGLTRSSRWLLWGLLAYLALPIDLVPDFLPGIGYADDVIVTAFVLRRVLATAGPEKLAEHWPGAPEGLVSLRLMLRLD
jgi:uncharacterized membrane protein YkvA (DUF1232 family)